MVDTLDVLSTDRPADCQLRCQISIWAMLPRDRHEAGKFIFGSWYLCCLFFLLYRCTNTQMAVDDNLIGFSSLTLPTTSTDKANLIHFFLQLVPPFMMTIIIKYFITYFILITDKANLIHSIYGTIFFAKSPKFSCHYDVHSGMFHRCWSWPYCDFFLKCLFTSSHVTLFLRRWTLFEAQVT